MAVSQSTHMLCRANSTGLLPYLIPFLHRPCPGTGPARASFSTSQCLQKRDNNRMRGMSAIRGTGLRKRQTLSVRNEPLPKPVLDRARHAVHETADDHGLWQFFGKERRCMTTPEDENSHGREWTTAELRLKNFEDLHRLWWTCLKERNRIATNQAERLRLRAGYGKFEATERDKVVQKTMANIRWALIERWYAFQDARQLAQDDPEVDLTGQGPAYTPTPYDEEAAFEEDATEGEGPMSPGETRLDEKTPAVPLPASSVEQRATV